MTEPELTVRERQEVQGEQTRPGRTYVPDVDIYESPESLWLSVDLPGVDETSVQVNLTNGVLSIDGQVELKDYDELTPRYTEYGIGNFARRFSVSTEVDTTRIAGRMRDGVLELELPKTERAKPRQIPISR
jgi:HSP20 family molecular chaperone IbpA